MSDQQTVSLTQEVEQNVAFASEQLLADGKVVPMLILRGELHVGIFALAIDMPESGEQRHQFFHNLGRHLGQEYGKELGAAQSLIHITEAWMRRMEKGEEEPPYRHLENDPQRIEVLVLTGYAPKTEEAVMRTLQMNRDSEGTLTSVEPLFDGKDGVQTRPYLLETFIAGYNEGLQTA